jgi:inner membrane protein
LDNVTHTLIGLVAGDALFAWRARRSRAEPAAALPLAQQEPGALVNSALRRATLLTSVLANNLPDLDFLYRGITPGKLGYLLHHRGHTHTFVASVPLALISVGITAWVLRARGRHLPLRDYWFLVGVALLGGALHILFDFGNNYGVHPFWPFDNRWYYGDAIFIVEPWLIVVLAGVALGARRSALTRNALWVLVALLLGAAWVSELLASAAALALTLAAVGWLAWLRQAGPRRRGVGAVLGLGLVAASFLGGRAEVRAELRRALESEPGELVSLSSTPAPGNPFCWWLLAVQRDGGDYLVREALVSSLPRVWPVQSCRWPTRGSTAPLSRSELGARAHVPHAIDWGPEFRAPLIELRTLARNNCVAAAFLRYARVPYWLTRDDRPLIIGDLRFDHSARLDFTDLELSPEQACPRFVPPWQPPLPLLHE